MKDQSFNRLQIGLSASSHFIVDIYQSFYVGLIPLLTFRFGLSLYHVTLLGATSIIANSLFSPFFGYMADRYNLKYFIVIGSLLTAVFLSLLGILPEYWIILIFLFIGNLGIAAYHPAGAAIAGYYGGKKKGFGTSLINFGGNFGSAIGVLMLILILEKIGIEYTPFAMIPGILMAIILLKYIPSKQSSLSGTEDYNFFLRLKKINKKKLYLIINLVFAVYSLYIVWISLINLMPLYFTEAGVSLINIGIILFLFSTLGGSAGFLSGFLYDRFRHGSFFIQAGLIISIPLIFFTFLTDGITASILFVLSGFFFVSVQPVCIRMTQDLLPGNMSFASSLILGFSAGLAGVTMIFLGKAADIIGIASLVKLELILFILVTIILFAYPRIDRKLSSENK